MLIYYTRLKSAETNRCLEGKKKCNQTPNEKMDGGNLCYMICCRVKHAEHPVGSIKCLITFNQVYGERQEQVISSYRLGREELRKQSDRG